MKEEGPFLKSIIGLLLFFSSIHMVLELQYFVWNIQSGSTLKAFERMYTANNVAYENRCFFWLLQNFMMLSNFVLLCLYLGFIYVKNLKWLNISIGFCCFKLLIAIIWQSLISSQYIHQALQNQQICDQKVIEEDGYTTTSCNINDLFLLERKLAITISIIQLSISIITPSYIKIRKYDLGENEPLIFSESLLN